MLKNILMALALLAPVAAIASTADDLARIRPLLPEGSDVAQIQAAMIQGASVSEANEAGAANYLIRDINGDGTADILVIAEKNPRMMDYTAEPALPCATWDAGKCTIEYYQRSLNLYLGQADGSYKRAFSNDKMVLNGDEGGVFGDPLQGLSVTGKGAIRLTVYGGSNWRWGFTDVMQFRHGDLYVIGQDSNDGWTGDGRFHSKSVNLLTGDVVETDQKSDESRVHTRHYKVRVKPLVRVSQYGGSSPS